MTINLEGVRAKLAAAAGGGQRELEDALGEVRTLLHSLGLTFEETAPLLNLMGAIEDHRTGKPHPLLAVSGNAGSSPHIMDSQFKGLTAAITTLIARRPGETVGTARALVSRTLASAGIDGSKVKTWHHEAANGRAHRDVHDAYQFFVDRMGELDERGVVAALSTLTTRGRVRL